MIERDDTDWRGPLLDALGVTLAPQETCGMAEIVQWVKATREIRPMADAPRSGYMLAYDGDDLPGVWSCEQYWLSIAADAPRYFPRDEAKALTGWMRCPVPSRIQKAERS